MNKIKDIDQLNLLIKNELQEYLIDFGKHISKIYKYLVDNNHNSENKFIFNDCDNHIYYIPNDKYKLIIFIDQNCNHLVAFKKSHFNYCHNPLEISCYNFYKKPDQFDEKYYLQNVNSCIKYSDHINHYITDEDLNENPTRPTLETVITNLNTTNYRSFLSNKSISFIGKYTADVYCLFLNAEFGLKAMYKKS